MARAKVIGTLTSFRCDVSPIAAVSGSDWSPVSLTSFLAEWEGYDIVRPLAQFSNKYFFLQNSTDKLWSTKADFFGYLFKGRHYGLVYGDGNAARLLLGVGFDYF